jgi:Protein of unknown function (DUF4007)
MPVLPTSSLCKNTLRSLLAQSLQPNSQTASLSAQTLRRARQWAIAANLLDENGLTPEGHLVITKDPYLETTVTDWVIHFYLSLDNYSLWHYFIYEFLQEHVSFTQEELLNSCTRRFINESPDKLRKSIRLILKAYIEAEAISKNRFLIQKEKTYSIGDSDLSNPYTVGYFLAKSWDQKYKTRSTVLVDEILDVEMGLITVLGISQEQLRQQLDVLAQHEIIEQRSLKPHFAENKPKIKDEQELSYQIYRTWNSPIEILEKAYENDIATPNRPLIQSLGDIIEDDDSVDFSQLLEWASRLVSLDGGSNTIVKLAS